MSSATSEMTSEEETIISRLLKAHQETYPLVPNDERFKLVRPRLLSTPLLVLVIARSALTVSLHRIPMSGGVWKIGSLDEDLFDDF